jgi:hypothetical protein
LEGTGAGDFTTDDISRKEDLKQYLEIFEAMYTVTDNQIVEKATEMLKLFLSFMPTEFKKAASLEEAYQKIRERAA